MSFMTVFTAAELDMLQSHKLIFYPSLMDFYDHVDECSVNDTLVGSL